MSNPNFCLLSGRLGKDPELTDGGTIQFDLCWKSSFKSAVHWIPCVALGVSAQIILKNRFRQGDLVNVAGKLLRMRKEEPMVLNVQRMYLIVGSSKQERRTGTELEKSWEQPAAPIADA